ncbi:MFS transporter [Paenibacillus sp. P46E]|uniref:MFS transporter n=1 Tax=Paenibacillus sp. P46E TaxID=1349436 RepID=UPI00093E4F45|nr:MFS transporter [Paenibacillus sp. P46E]OKP97038.1 MFS transporter [Paenibacillus sp. P46E]
MIKKLKTNVRELRTFLILWITQSFSALGSAMTSFALVIWSYQQQGSALTSSLLVICSYAPYVLLSIFAGALSDRWNKKATMLISDSFAALCTVSILILMTTGTLQIWHLYLINTLNGLMNTVQQPASDVAISLLAPQKHYQKVSGMRSLSNSLVTILTPILATSMLSFTSIRVVILFDLITFATAFMALLCWVHIPQVPKQSGTGSETVLQSAKSGLRYLRDNRGILDLIFFLAVINFTASIFNAALPAMMLSRVGGGELALGMVNTVTGIAMMVGSISVAILPSPKSRVRVILNCLLFSMSSENFILAFGRSTPVWCLGAILGWIFIPVMNANMDVLFRSTIPIEMQGRVYSARNTLQFFTIPVGYLCGGVLVDRVFEPFMAGQPMNSLWVTLVGTGKGSGAALLFLAIGIFGACSCLPFRADKHIWKLEE